MTKQLPQEIESMVQEIEILFHHNTWNDIDWVREIVERYLSLPKQEKVCDAVKDTEKHSLVWCWETMTYRCRICQKKWSVDNITERWKCTTQPQSQ